MNQEVLIEFTDRIIHELYRMQIREHNDSHPSTIDSLSTCKSSACRRVEKLMNDWTKMQIEESK